MGFCYIFESEVRGNDAKQEQALSIRFGLEVALSV